MKTQKELQIIANRLWLGYCEALPRLVKFDCPIIEINNRFTKTAGLCYIEENRVQLGGKFFAKHHNNMLLVILPHELAHQIDCNLYGCDDSYKPHRKSWKDIMVKIGQKPDIYHNMEI